MDGSKLRELLALRFNEGELRTLCFDLKNADPAQFKDLDYDSLPGAGVADKGRELVAYFERRQSLPVLIQVGRARRADITWPSLPEMAAPGASLGPTRKKYYVASARDESEIAAKFDVSDEHFERTTNFAEAYLVIFDLSKPPVDWLKYVGGKDPLLPFMVFVALEGVTRLDGTSILDVVHNCYEFKAQVWQDQKDLLVAMKTAEYVRKLAEQIELAARNMALAGEKKSL